jgi:hypothetical protein
MKLFEKGPNGAITSTPDAELWAGVLVFVGGIYGCYDFFHPLNAQMRVFDVITGIGGMISGPLLA